MRLIPWRAATIRTPFDAVHDEFDRVFERFFGGVPANFDAQIGERQAFAPSVDVVDKGDAFLVRAELPGLEAKDVKLSCERDHLVLSGEKKSEHKVDGKGFARFESRYGSFSRVVPLPAEVVGTKANATFKQGVLEVTLPKAESARAQNVEIKVQA